MGKSGGMCWLPGGQRMMPGECRTSRLHHCEIENIMDAGERGGGVYIQLARQTR